SGYDEPRTLSYQITLFGPIGADVRQSVNTYRPANMKRMPGDAAPFLNHLALVIPDAGDRKVVLDFLAHNAKYPGHKIPWAPLVQSVEGVGKGIIKEVMAFVMGEMFWYGPNALELVGNGSKFNAWMKDRLMIIVDEVKCDENRRLVEVLKPLISEKQIEIQGKGIDQKKSDNPSNWIFFSNHKEAIPINQNSRRWAIFYSAVQTEADLFNLGMNDQYFKRLYDWLGGRDNGDHQFGLMMVADYLLSYPIARGAIPMRAPRTTSFDEAVVVSRGPIEQAISEAVDQGQSGFRGGWISGGWISRTKARGLFKRDYSTQAITKAIKALGYHYIGRSSVAIFQEDQSKPELYNLNRNETCENYGFAQGYGLIPPVN
ncbi:DUF5906 domain-containing protein, partial [Rhodobacteraceae bacterium KMM 6894]|nr:DUF5906 domain-containing protein [Rhodobacteraceae bacterium KMM 6894]